MAPQTASLQSIESRLDTIRVAIKRLFLLDGVARLFVAVAVFVVATFVLDYTFILPRGVRLVFLFAGLASFAWLAARRIAYPMAVRISDDDLALFVERHYPDLNDRLISALQLARSPQAADTTERIAGFNSPELVEALINDASAAASALDFNGVIVRQHVMKIAMWAGVLALALGVAGSATATTRNLARIYGQRALGLNVKWPQRTNLEVKDIDPNTREKTIARGDDFVLTVGFQGRDPGRVRLHYTFATGEQSRETMTATAGELYTYTFTHVAGPFTFRVSGGDDETEDYQIHTKNPPGVEELRLFMQFPEYLRMANTPEDQPILGGNIQAPQYTSVRFVAVCNEDLAEASLKLGVKGKESQAPLTIGKDSKGQNALVTGTIDVSEAYSEYQLDLVAKNGLPNRDPIRYTIKGLIDARPTSSVFDPLGEENVTEICQRPISAEIKDDNGIAEIFFEYRKDGKVSTDWTPVKMTAEHMKPAECGAGVRTIKIDYTLDFAPIQAIPGEYVRFRFRAADYKDVKGDRNVHIGKEYRFAVVPFTVLEKELQDQLEKVKQNLEALRKRQQGLYDNTARLDTKFAKFEQLNPEQAGEVRYAGNEQSGVTDKLAIARADIDKVKRRGVYNKIFDERAAAKLVEAIDALDGAIAPRGPSPMATTIFRDASKERSDTRSKLLNTARAFQSQVLSAIDAALRALDKWSSYQEIVRLVRVALEEQQKVIRAINERLMKKDEKK